MGQNATSLDHLVGAGTVSPSALAVLRLIVISNLFGCIPANRQAFRP
jgi:hypothetical protein